MASEAAILLKDVQGEKGYGKIAGLLKSGVKVVCRGELLLTLPRVKVIPRKDGKSAHNYQWANDPAVTLFCTEEDVAPLSDYEYHLMVAIKSREARYEVFHKENLDWGSKLKENRVVHVSLPSKAVVSSHHALAIIRYIGPLPNENGVQFGVEIMDGQFRQYCSSNGFFGGQQFFTCDENSALFVSLDRLSPVEPLHQNQQVPTLPADIQKHHQMTIRAQSKAQQPRDLDQYAHHRGHAPKQPHSHFKLNDRVLVHDKCGTGIHGSVKWIEEVKYSGDTLLAIGIETDVSVQSKDFVGSLHGMTQHFKCSNDRHGKLVMPESMVYSEKEDAVYRDEKKVKKKNQESSVDAHVHAHECAYAESQFGDEEKVIQQVTNISPSVRGRQQGYGSSWPELQKMHDQHDEHLLGYNRGGGGGSVPLRTQRSMPDPVAQPTHSQLPASHSHSNTSLSVRGRQQGYGSSQPELQKMHDQHNVQDEHLLGYNRGGGGGSVPLRSQRSMPDPIAQPTHSQLPASHSHSNTSLSVRGRQQDYGSSRPELQKMHDQHNVQDEHLLGYNRGGGGGSVPLRTPRSMPDPVAQPTHSQLPASHSHSNTSLSVRGRQQGYGSSQPELQKMHDHHNAQDEHILGYNRGGGGGSVPLHTQRSMPGPGATDQHHGLVQHSNIVKQPYQAQLDPASDLYRNIQYQPGADSDPQRPFDDRRPSDSTYQKLPVDGQIQHGGGTEAGVQPGMDSSHVHRERMAQQQLYEKQQYEQQQRYEQQQKYEQQQFEHQQRLQHYGLSSTQPLCDPNQFQFPNSQQQQQPPTDMAMYGDFEDNTENYEQEHKQPEESNKATDVDQIVTLQHEFDELKAKYTLLQQQQENMNSENIQLQQECTQLKIEKAAHAEELIETEKREQAQHQQEVEQIQGQHQQVQGQHQWGLQQVQGQHQRELQQVQDQYQRELQQMAAEKQSVEQRLLFQENYILELERKLETANTEVKEVRFTQLLNPQGADSSWNVPRNEVMVKEEIGRGASGLVSKGQFRGQNVAVKQIHQFILSQKHVVTEFKREVRIMASVQHPNLVRFIGAVFDESVENFTATPLLLLELLHTNLRKAYEQRPSNLGASVMLSIFRDMAYGLHYLHEHQEPIIHRDVSAPNVLLEALPGGTWRAKLSDFGSANFLKRSSTLGVGAIICTAPEMFPRDDPSAPVPRPTVKCDVFSYGIVLVEVVTKTMPSLENRHQLFQEVEQKWRMMHDLVTQCTQRRPEDRPTMSAVLNQLNRFPVARPR